MRVCIGMICTIYNERQSSAQQNSDLHSPTLVQQPLPEAQQMMNNPNEFENAILFSPVSTDTTVSLSTPVLRCPADVRPSAIPVQHPFVGLSVTFYVTKLSNLMFLNCPNN